MKQPSSLQPSAPGTRQRFFAFACWLFNAPMPDRPARPANRRWIEAGARLLVLVVLCTVSGYLITTGAEAGQGFIYGVRDGWHGETSAVAYWNISAGALVGMSLMLVMVFQGGVLKKAIRRTSDRLHLERERASRQALESTLRLLKAQIEPHFLFNTLGAVQQLAEDKAPQAAALTRELIAFLRASMGSLRGDSIRLDDDCAICEAYLRIMQARLGPRLAFSVDYPGDLSGYRLPTTMLLTLLENAVKHGIERAPAGGQIAIRVTRQQEQVVIAVADTGAGLGLTVGQGVGLQHIHERLALVYGEAARLTIAENKPSGVVARLYLPGRPLVVGC